MFPLPFINCDCWWFDFGVGWSVVMSYFDTPTRFPSSFWLTDILIGCSDNFLPTNFHQTLLGKSSCHRSWWCGSAATCSSSSSSFLLVPLLCEIFKWWKTLLLFCRLIFDEQTQFSVKCILSSVATKSILAFLPVDCDDCREINSEADVKTLQRHNTEEWPHEYNITVIYLHYV